MRQVIFLACAVVILAGSAVTSIPMRGGRQPTSAPTVARAPAPTAADADVAGRSPRVEWVALSEKGAPGIRVRAAIEYGKAPIAVLRRGDAEVARAALTKGPEIWSGELAADPGDYQLTVTDGASPPVTIGVMVRTLTCFRGERRLIAREVVPGTLVRVGAEPTLVVPRWFRQDQDVSFVVEWMRDGKLVYEHSGHTDHLRQNLAAIEGMFLGSRFESMCSHAFGETYTAPDLAHGSWEVRVHREGAESLMARFEVTPGPPRVELPFVALPRAESGAARVRRVPSCPGLSKTRNLATGKTTGWPACGEIGHSRTGEAVPATAAEYRAFVRDGEVFAIRTRMAEVIAGEGPLDRPDFEYDDEQSPDANWHRKRAWDKRDTERHFANQRTLAARARKHRPALAARIKQFGGAWTAEETPAPAPLWRPAAP